MTRIGFLRVFARMVNNICKWIASRRFDLQAELAAQDRWDGNEADFFTVTFMTAVHAMTA